MTIKAKENSEIDTEIKVLSDEIASVVTQREELHVKYIEDDYFYANRMTELFKKRCELVKKKKIREQRS